MSEPDLVAPELLDRLVDEVLGPGTVGIALTGSHARGTAGSLSDVDLLHFSESLPTHRTGRYRLAIVEGRLVSLSTTTVEDKRGELWDPCTAILAVPGLRQARVLWDTDGKVAELIEEALSFRWTSVEEEATSAASYELRGLAEEVAKALGALERRDVSAQLYGTLGLVLGLPKVVAMARGILIESENSFFREVQEAVGSSSLWSRIHRVASGYVSGCGPALRASAAVHLYSETRDLLATLLEEADLEVIDSAGAWIRDASIPQRDEVLAHEA